MVQVGATKDQGMVEKYYLHPLRSSTAHCLNNHNMTMNKKASFFSLVQVIFTWVLNLTKEFFSKKISNHKPCYYYFVVFNGATSHLITHPLLQVVHNLMHLYIQHRFEQLWSLVFLVLTCFLKALHYSGSISTYILSSDPWNIPETENNQAWRKGRSGREGSMGDEVGHL